MIPGFIGGSGIGCPYIESEDLKVDDKKGPIALDNNEDKNMQPVRPKALKPGPCPVLIPSPSDG